MPIPLSSNIEPRNGNTFPLVEDIYVKGGIRPVATYADIAAIAAEHKKPGMLFYVIDSRSLLALDNTLEPVAVVLDTLRIAVIGDSVNALVPGQDLSASRYLQDALVQSGAAQVQVINAAQGGGTYASSNTTSGGFQFGTMSQIEYAAQFDPQIILFVLGANDIQGAVDSNGVVNNAAIASLVTVAKAALDRARTLCPHADIFVVEEQVHDSDIPYFNGDVQYGVRNHSVIPFLWDYTGGETSDDLASQFLWNRGLGQVKAIIKFTADLRTALTAAQFHFHAAAVPYFKIARLGGISSDLLHPSATGMKLLGAALFDIVAAATILQSNGQPTPGQYLVPQLNRRDHTATFLTLFNSVFPAAPAAATGVRTPVYTNNFGYFRETFKDVDPKMWYAPVRPKVFVTPTGGQSAPVTVTVKGAAPYSQIDYRINNSAWFLVGQADGEGNAFVQLNDSDQRPGTFDCSVRCGPPYSGSPSTIVGPVEVEVTSSRTVRIAVIGDSMSYGHTDSLPAWPAVLEEKLNGLGSNVKIQNCSLGGGSFATAMGRTTSPVNEQYRFGTMTAVELAISFDPDIVIVMLGANDSGGYVNIDGTINQTAKDAVYQDIDVTLAHLHAQLPNARICYASQNLGDGTDWNFNTAKNKHIALGLGHEVRAGTTVLSVCRSAEVMDDPAAIWAKVRVREMLEMRAYIAGIGYVTSYVVDYFKAARMGGLGADQAHMNAGGHQMLAAMHFKQLMDVPELPNAPRFIWTAHNDWEHLFNNALERVGDGYVERLAGRYNFVNGAFPGGMLDPFYWWSALSPSIEMVNTVNNEQELLIHAQGLTPLAAIEVTVGSSNTRYVLGTTNSRGALLGRLKPQTIGMQVGNNVIRLHCPHPLGNTPPLYPHVFGPFNVTYS